MSPFKNLIDIYWVLVLVSIIKIFFLLNPILAIIITIAAIIFATWRRNKKNDLSVIRNFSTILLVNTGMIFALGLLATALIKDAAYKDKGFSVSIDIILFAIGYFVFIISKAKEPRNKKI